MAPSGIRVAGLTKTISFPLGDVNVRLTELALRSPWNASACWAGKWNQSYLDPWTSFSIHVLTQALQVFLSVCVLDSVLICVSLFSFRDFKKHRQCIYDIYLFPLPITNVSLKKPLAAQVLLAAAERTWALVHSQDASWTVLNLVWYMPPGDMPPCFLKWHIWARLSLGANASLFPSAMPSQASLQDLVASQFSFKMSRKQVCVFILTRPGPDLDLWPFTLGRVHVVHCHQAQTQVPWGVLSFSGRTQMVLGHQHLETLHTVPPRMVCRLWTAETTSDSSYTCPMNRVFSWAGRFDCWPVPSQR